MNGYWIDIQMYYTYIYKFMYVWRKCSTFFIFNFTARLAECIMWLDSHILIQKHYIIIFMYALLVLRTGGWCCIYVCYSICTIVHKVQNIYIQCIYVRKIKFSFFFRKEKIPLLIHHSRERKNAQKIHKNRTESEFIGYFVFMCTYRSISYTQLKWTDI